MIFLKFCGQFAAFDHPHFVKETLDDQNYAEYYGRCCLLVYCGILDSQFILLLDFGLFRTGKNRFIQEIICKKIFLPANVNFNIAQTIVINVVNKKVLMTGE